MSVVPHWRTGATAGFWLDTRIDDGESRLEHVEGQFDLIFLDADKHNYQLYMNRILERRLLSPHGVVLVDNGTLFLSP